MRPLTGPERQNRKDELARQAATLFCEVGYQGLTTDAVAKAAGVAKGTLFLSFASKEDLMLHAAGLRFADWFRRLLVLDPTLAPEPLARALFSTIVEDPLLMPLLGLVGPVLEQGCTPGAVLGFKEGLASGLKALSAAWGGTRPRVSEAAWEGLFLRVYALIVGAWSVGEASDTVRDALAGRPDLLPLLTRFEDLVVPMLEAQLQAIFVP